MSKIELLAPAGSLDSMYAGINSGADAIYMGGSKFSARAYASNFDNTQLEKAVDYAHLRGVKIYITLNTLIKQEEMQEVMDYVDFLYTIGVDALIIQDIGLAYLLRSNFPDFEIHASTQMTIHNGEGALFFKDLGFKRIVLARELSLSEITYISKELKIDTEIFIHGALCICYSGQCLMSSMIGGRSGNRGRCAQPCRLPYKLINLKNGSEKSAYVMSPKDTCTIDSIKDIINTGTASLKIEGRMKRPEYVSGVVNSYRKAIDAVEKEKSGFDYKKEEKILMQLFNREGFGKAYLYKNHGKDMMAYNFPKNTGISLGIVEKDGSIYLKEDISIGDGVRIKDDGFSIAKILINGKEVSSAKAKDRVNIIPKLYNPGNELYKTLDTKLMKYYEDNYINKDNKILLDAEVVFKVGEPLSIKIVYKNKLYEEKGEIVQKSLNKPITIERLSENIKKSSEVDFKIDNINYIYYEEGFTPISDINNTRRKILNSIQEEDLLQYKRKSKKVKLEDFKSNDRLENIPKVMVNINTKEQLKAILESDITDIIINPFYRGEGSIDKDYLSKLNLEDKNVYIKVPNIVKGEFNSICEYIKEVISKIKGIVTGNIGIINRFKDITSIYGDYKLNIINKYALKALEGITYINCLSLELNKQEIKNITKGEDFPLQMLIYGRPELMVSEYCPIGSLMGGKSSCKDCSGECMKANFILKDRMNENFILKTDIYCRSYMYNSSPIDLLDRQKEIIDLGISSFRLDFIEEDYETTKMVLRCFKDRKGIKDFSSFTRGHYKRGVE